MAAHRKRLCNATIVLALLAAGSGCSGADPTKGSSARIDSTPSDALTITRAPDEVRKVSTTGETQIELSGPENTVCRIHGEAEAPDQFMEVVTDSVGLAEFTFELDPGRTTPGVLFFDCPTAGDAIVRTSVTLEPTDATVAPPNTRLARVLASGVQRPALVGDPLSFSPQYLASHDYPPRPDVQSSHFKRWLEDVSAPRTKIEPGAVPRPTRTHTIYNLLSWAGYAVASSSAIVQVFGEWTVPHVTNVPGGGSHSEYSSIWVGLDGGHFLSTADILQAGSEQDITYISSHGTSRSYSTWFEWAPGGGVTLGDVPVSSSGVRIDVEVYPCDPNNVTQSDFGGSYGCLYISASDDSWYFYKKFPKPSGVSFYGDCAEWIVEATAIGPDHIIPNLADFGSFQLTYAEDAEISSNGWTPFNQEPAYNKFKMVDTLQNGVLLATPSVVDDITINYQWDSKGTRPPNPE